MKLIGLIFWMLQEESKDPGEISIISFIFFGLPVIVLLGCCIFSLKTLENERKNLSRSQMRTKEKSKRTALKLKK